MATPSRDSVFLARHLWERHTESASGAVALHLDITEGKRGEADLLCFGAAMDGSVDAINLIDRSTMAFVHVNEVACRMREQTREQLLALGPAEVLGTSRAKHAKTYTDHGSYGDHVNVTAPTTAHFQIVGNA